jgi:hypothetical protein
MLQGGGFRPAAFLVIGSERCLSKIQNRCLDAHQKRALFTPSYPATGNDTGS